MEAEDLKKITEAIDEKIKAAATKEDLEKIKSEMRDELKAIKTGTTDEQLQEAVKAAKTELEGKLKAQWEEVVKLTAKDPTEAKPKTFRETIKQAIIDSGFVEKYTNEDGEEKYRIKGSDVETMKYHIKVAVDMNTANAVRPGSTPGMNIGSLTDYSMMSQLIPNTMNTHFLGAFSVQPTSEKYFGVVIETTETDGSDIKAETSSAGDSSYLLKTLEYKVFDFSVKFRVHQNTLDDIDNVITRVETIGVDRLLSKIDYYTLGAGGDNSATPYGIKTTNFFTAYDTTLRQGEVQSANIVNVIKNMVLQAAQADRMVDTVVLNRLDAAEIEDLKDANDNSVKLAGIVVDATGKLSYIYGLKVIINNKVTTNTCWVLNAANSLVYGVRKGMGIRIGYDQTADFSKNIVTIQPECRVAIGIGAPEEIIYCSDIAAAATSLSIV